MAVLFLIAGALICGWQAIRSPRLLTAALWLAGVSALVAIVLYWLGAHEAAVMELSVGSGLVTVLFVFAIATAGEDAMAAPAVVPRWLACALAVGSVALLAWLALPLGKGGVAEFTAEGAQGAEASFTVVLWQERALDVLVQIGLIFAAVLGVLGLLAETDTAARLGSQPVESVPVAEPALSAVEVSPVAGRQSPVERKTADYADGADFELFICAILSEKPVFNVQVHCFQRVHSQKTGFLRLLRQPARETYS